MLFIVYPQFFLHFIEKQAVIFRDNRKNPNNIFSNRHYNRSYMKQNILFLAIIILLGSCNNDKKKVADKSEEHTEQVKDAIEDVDKTKEELSKLTPATTEQLQSMLPESLLGLARKDPESNESMGAVSASATYEFNDSTSFSLSIFDCAGPGGAGIYSMQYLGLLNIREDNEDEYTKPVEFKGNKAFEHCDKTTNDCAFTFFAGGRYLVTLEGQRLSADKLKEAAGQISFR